MAGAAPLLPLPSRVRIDPGLKLAYALENGSRRGHIAPCRENAQGLAVDRRGKIRMGPDRLQFGREDEIATDPPII